MYVHITIGLVKVAESVMYVSPLLQTCIGFSVDPDANHPKLSLG